MQISSTLSREKILPAMIVALFAAIVIMLRRYADTTKIWFASLILLATVLRGFNRRELRRTSPLDRAFFAVLVTNFLGIAFCLYIDCLGEDHFEGKSTTMMVTVFVAVLLARLSSAQDGPARTVDFTA